ncbi:hypothetical protein F4802DRAFT_597192 [Xylaria palmicola]|nr:hypothetical protein F4802DRAFT_597192 [Xylaria palmicola]
MSQIPIPNFNGPQGGPPGGHFPGVVPGYPQRNMVQGDLRRGPAIQISDVSKELWSESDMKEDLTEYMVVRFERKIDKNGFDDQGQLKWPSWEKAIRIVDRSISKEVAARKIRQLNYSTKSVLDKKDSLLPPLRLQVDTTLEILMNHESDANFYWTLAQMDHQLRPIKAYFANDSNHHSARGHRSSSHRLSSKKRSRSGGSSHHSKKRAYERVSLTAYFQRVPKPGVNIPRLWREYRKTVEGAYQPLPGAMHSTMPLSQSIPTHFQVQQPGVGGQGQQPIRVPNQNPQGTHPGQQHPPPNRQVNQESIQINRGSPPQQNPNNRGLPPQHNPNNRGLPPQHNLDNGARRTRRPDSDSDSGHDSRSSRISSSSRTDTAPSSVSGPRPGGQHKDQHQHNHPGPYPHPHAPMHERPRDNRAANGSPRLPRVSLSPHRAPPRPVPPYPLSHENGSVASHIERVREDAYQRGRLAERTDARLAEELAEDLAFSRDRGRYGIHSRSPPARRPFRTRSDDEDDHDHTDALIRRYLARLSVRDDGDGEDDAELRRRRREFEDRAQRGSILEDDPFEGSRSSSSAYTYSTDGRGRGRASVISAPRLRPLSPRPPRGPAYYR